MIIFINNFHLKIIWIIMLFFSKTNKKNKKKQKTKNKIKTDKTSYTIRGLFYLINFTLHFYSIVLYLICLLVYIHQKAFLNKLKMLLIDFNAALFLLLYLYLFSQLHHTVCLRCFIPFFYFGGGGSTS